MTDVTQILSKIKAGHENASADLLPVVYDELRKLATSRMAMERPDHTLQATALVHEAFIRLVDGEQIRGWESRGHFFAAAAEAMRRILVDAAHRKATLKRGGDRVRIELTDANLAVHPPSIDVLALNEALDALSEIQPETVQLVKLRYFAGLTNAEAAQALVISSRKADALWAYARVWLHRRIYGSESQHSP